MADFLSFDLVSEKELANDAEVSTWMLCDCGHDCCTCDSECK